MDICSCVIGLGKSGFAAAKLLLSRNVKVKVTELNNTAEIRKKASLLCNLGAKVEIGKHSSDFYENAALYILSPGIAGENPVVSYAIRNNLPLISEIELAWMFSPARVIAITGTNGKTSVTTYTYNILKKANLPVHIAGNVGIPFSEIVSNLKAGDFVVLELSSFQLENIDNFHPFIAALLNISEDHMDRYKNINDYLAAKMNIFKNQTASDLAILDLSDDIIRRESKRIRAKIMDISKLDLEGLNSNEKFIYLIAISCGCDKKFILKEITKIKKLKHRMEEVACIDGIRFINDSKATNPHATKWALNSIDSDVILIAGGRDKNMDFKLVREDVACKVKALIVFGEAKDKIVTSLGGFVEVVKIADSLKEASLMAFKEAVSGDTIILSPMCASFDMFKNYEDRGNKFKKIVKEIQKCKN